MAVLFLAFMGDLIKHVTEVTTVLSDLAQKDGYNLKELTRIWVMLPIDDSQGITYLEAASQSILEAAALVDNTFPTLEYHQKTAKKYRLMAELLRLKADQLDKLGD